MHVGLGAAPNNISVFPTQVATIATNFYPTLQGPPTETLDIFQRELAS